MKHRPSPVWQRPASPPRGYSRDASVISSSHAKIEGIRGTQKAQTFVFGTARGREAGFITPQGLWLALRAAPEELPRVRVAAERKPAPPPAEPVDRSSFITVAEPEPDPEDVPSMMPVLEPEPEPPPLEQAPPHSLKPFEPEPPPPGPPPAPAPAPMPEPERDQLESELELELEVQRVQLQPEPEPEPEPLAPIPLLAPPSCPAAASTRTRLHRAAPRLGIEILFRDMGAYGPASNATAPDLMQRHRRAQLLPKQLSFLVHTKSWSGATTSIQLQTVNVRCEMHSAVIARATLRLEDVLGSLWCSATTQHACGPPRSTPLPTMIVRVAHSSNPHFLDASVTFSPEVYERRSSWLHQPMALERERRDGGREAPRILVPLHLLRNNSSLPLYHSPHRLPRAGKKATAAAVPNAGSGFRRTGEPEHGAFHHRSRTHSDAHQPRAAHTAHHAPSAAASSAAAPTGVALAHTERPLSTEAAWSLGKNEPLPATAGDELLGGGWKWWDETSRLHVCAIHATRNALAAASESVEQVIALDCPRLHLMALDGT